LFSIPANFKYSLIKLNKVVEQIDQISVSRLYDFIDASIETEIVEDDKLDITFVVKESEKFYVKKVSNHNAFLIFP